MAFHIPAVLMVAALTAASAAWADDVPNLSYERTCRPLPGVDTALRLDTERCLKSERDARDQLTREWPSFPPADRTLCTQTASMGGLPSYVELLTCLELRREVAKLPADRGLISRPSGLRTR